jgi:hypothetical protein
LNLTSCEWGFILPAILRNKRFRSVLFGSAAAILSFVFHLSSASADIVYDVECKRGDCFKYGWVMYGAIEAVNATCTNLNCAKFGWTAEVDDDSVFTVVCKDDSCFGNGWTSKQQYLAITLEDDVTCGEAGCLKDGWKVKTGYDMMGGNVTCNKGNCAKYGGTSEWRGHRARTECNSADCYHDGWTLFIEE